MRSTPHEARAGHTALEVLIAMGVLFLVIGLPGRLFESMGRVHRQGSTAAQLETAGRHALDEVAKRLASADATQITPGLGSPLSSNSIRFRRVVGFDDQTVPGTVDLLYGDFERIQTRAAPADPADGLDNDGDGLVDEGQLVHVQENAATGGEITTVLAEGVAASLQGEFPGNGEDDNGNELVDEAGLCFDFDGTRVNVRLTLIKGGSDGALEQQTIEKRITLRNREPVNGN